MRLLWTTLLVLSNANACRQAMDPCASSGSFQVNLGASLTGRFQENIATQSPLILLYKMILKQLCHSNEGKLALSEQPKGEVDVFLESNDIVIVV